MKNNLFLFTALCFIVTIQAQKREFKCQEIYKAAKLIDEGKYDESIAILKECEKADPKDYAYPYEIALAYTHKEEYQKAIDQLEKIKNYAGVEADLYQLLGNNYDYVKNPKKAIEIYEEGLTKFPNAGRLYLEKGVVYESQENYVEAVLSYEKGIEVDPMYPSNYYRASLLYLDSDDKLAGLMYGEIFVNIERTTKRTQKISELLFNTYKNNIQFKDNEIKIDFCKNVNDDNVDAKNLKLPFCAVYRKNLSLSLLGQKEITLKSLSEIRTAFIKNYFKDDYKKFSNVILEYQKTLFDAGLFETYNEYLFQMGAQDEFDAWQTANQDKMDEFIAWYTVPENILKITKENTYLAN
ncbi:tetratricopeptide repeat protein [Flavobacterium sp. KACC 22761]|uniref:tetratricopeptide repeat protein n=1 Tax=Flavobacterium sp. KACC 22761 TaxID=3092665 RepID=UPI002A748CCE|nr:tetratricopeptide repeat protein [Flavobacterium sp. KACC 22761]WPO77192.1 tetratricopeptide repeat protein [Flavobacterium sp. KACC 22761]